MHTVVRVVGRSLARISYRIAGHLPTRLKLWLVQLREARFLVGVLAVVLDEHDRVLLFRHTYRPFAPWGLPSGVLRPEERIEDSMKREIREEAGLDVEFVEILQVKAGSRPRRIDVWMRYQSRGGGTARPSAEVEAAEFFDLAALPPLIREQEEFLRSRNEELRSHVR